MKKQNLSKNYLKACLFEMLLHVILLAYIIIGICYVAHSTHVLEWLIIIFLSILCSYKSCHIFYVKYPEDEYEEKELPDFKFTPDTPKENELSNEKDSHFKECPFHYCDSNPKCEGKCRYDD